MKNNKSKVVDAAQSVESTFAILNNARRDFKAKSTMYKAAQTKLQQAEVNFAKAKSDAELLLNEKC